MDIAVFVFIMIFIKIHAMDSSEEELDNPYNTYSPSTSNTQDLYKSTFISTNEDSAANDDDFTMSNIHTISAEFHPGVLKITRITPTPKIILSPALRQKNKSIKEKDITDEPEMIQIIPNRNVQRGVLDILFPPTRVKSFKNVFDSLRRILSYTFRK